MDRPQSRVLDLGCSSGLLSQELRSLGHYVVGVDVVTHPEVKERTDEFYQADLDQGLPTGLPTAVMKAATGPIISVPSPCARIACVTALRAR
jgi:predicted TPR repeat methyltransferase